MVISRTKLQRLNNKRDEIIEEHISRYLFGGLASAAALFVTHPIDVVKINMQVKPLTTREVIAYYYNRDRSVFPIYKGIGVSICRTLIYGNLRFEVYEWARRNNFINTFQEKVAAASVGGALGGFVVSPVTMVHVRTQNDGLLATNERRYYNSLMHGLGRIYKEEGFRKLFAGSVVYSFRGMMGTIAQLALYDEIKLYLERKTHLLEGGFTLFAVASVAAGFVTTLMQQPFEVIAFRQMSAPIGFYKGLLPAFARVVPQTVVTYLILEYLRMHFGLLLKSRRSGEVVEIVSITEE